MEERTTSKQQWGTKIGVILAVSGSAVGLGNFLRFPGQAAQNGGGAFMLPYFCALLFLGIPIGWAEWTMGRYGGKRGLHSAPSILASIGRNRFFLYMGVIGVLIPLAVSFYYTYIESWCLGYAWYYLTGGIGVDTSQPIAQQTATAKDFFARMVGLHSHGIFTAESYETFIFWAIAFSVNIYLIYRGISGGIEKFCSLAMPTMAVCALFVLIRVLTLGTPDPSHPEQNVINGLGYMWNPNFSALTNSQTWLAAAGQIFFSLSVGFGVIINYASYMRRNSDVVLSALTASATNELFEVSFGGLITLTASFVFLGLSGTIDAVSGGTFGLGFATLPVVFAHMGKVGNLVGAVWFFMLFLAAITSSVSMYQPALAFLQESMEWNRKHATTVLVGICLIGSVMVMYFSEGMRFLDTIDSWVGTFLIFVMASVQLIAFAWFFGIEKGWEEAHEGARIRIPSFYKIIMKYISPLYLGIVFVSFCYRNLPDWITKVTSSIDRILALLLLAGVTLFLFICTVIWEKRSQEQGVDIFGEREEKS